MPRGKGLALAIASLVVVLLVVPAFLADEPTRLGLAQPNEFEAVRVGSFRDTGQGVVPAADRFSTCSSCVLRDVSVGMGPVALAYDVGMKEVFVANYGSDNVSVIPDGTGTSSVNIEVGTQPFGLAYDQGRGEVFVSNMDSCCSSSSSSDNVSVINDTTNRVVANVSVGGWPEGLAYDRGRGEVFVANYGSNNVSIIEDSTNRVVANIPVGQEPVALAYDPAKGEVFADGYSHGSNYPAIMSVINDTSNSVVATIPVGYSLSGVGDFPLGAVSYDGARGEVLVTNEGSDNVSIINDSSNLVVANIPVGTSPDGLTSTPSTGATFVANVWSGNTSVIDDHTNTVVATLDLGNASAAAYDSGEGDIALAEEADNAVIFVPINLTEGAALVPARSSADIGQPVVLNVTAIANPSAYSYTYASPGAMGCSPSTSASTVCTPTATGTFTVSATITDPFGEVSTVTSPALTVDASLNATLTLSNSTLWLGDTLYVSGVARGGLPPYTYNFTGLPPGCVSQGLDSIGCLPTQSGNYSIRFIVHDANVWSVAAVQQLSVKFDFIVLVPASTMVGHSVTIQIDSAPGFGPLTYSYSNLPPGCISQDSPTVICTPSHAGDYSVVVSVHDEAGDHASHTFALRVLPGTSTQPGFLDLPGDGGYVVLAAVAAAITGLVIFMVARRRPRSPAEAGAKTDDGSTETSI